MRRQADHAHGDITMFGGSGVRTLFGGDIQMLTPGGQLVVGVEGQVPPATLRPGHARRRATSRSIAKGSILLGLSRIMTTFGGDILAWSAEGDINAGRGAKTTMRLHAAEAGLRQLRQRDAVAEGAVLGRRHRHAQSDSGSAEPGDIDLIAPLGTIDAGEAGIRVSGNVNLAALHIVNAANIQAQGNTTGVPQIQAPNIGGLTEASNTAGAAAQQAATPEQAARNAQPSVIIVEVLGFGGGEGRRRGRTKAARRDQAKPI